MRGTFCAGCARPVFSDAASIFPAWAKPAWIVTRNFRSCSNHGANFGSKTLRPYQTLKRELPFVMVAHCAYPSVTGDKMPASLSRKWMTEVLRRKIGYRGLIVSDDLEMGGVQATAEIGDAAVATIRAGADIFLVCHKEENVWRTFYTVLAEAERDSRFRQQVEAAAERLRKFKISSRALNQPPAPSPTDAVVDKLRCELRELGEKLRLAGEARAAAAAAGGGARVNLSIGFALSGSSQANSRMAVDQ